VPKLAANLASLLLIASSIGVNMARYPQIGQAVDKGQPADGAHAVDTARSPEPSIVIQGESENALAATATVADATTPRQAKAVTAVDKPQDESPSDSLPVVNPLPAQPAPEATILEVRPLVPVPGLRTAPATADVSNLRDEVRRLPPVDSEVPGVEVSSPDNPVKSLYPGTSTP
jgi:hypothetical protein